MVCAIVFSQNAESFTVSEGKKRKKNQMQKNVKKAYGFILN